MSLAFISETVTAVKNMPQFSKEVQKFVVEFSFKTKDKDLTNKLMDELTVPDSDFEMIKMKYQTMYDKKPKWVGQIENLLVALEMYRVEEEKAINRLSDVLKGYGIDVTPEEIRKTDTQELKERVKKEILL
ncbi:hypothetical protein [[Clostridium] fimetarium]|uniref:Uncharacterized protein n=1 Tax=[Clostridium] fimetarium TaxID=99656 RepID=A0A1I0NGY6_9FIRM|nr:hypothetical protein [[Clostridium] fimetarium]SEW00742.1 hypothetical protein SAMN05421659_103104 [[Clostridium] fimetarium]